MRDQPWMPVTVYKPHHEKLMPPPKHQQGTHVEVPDISHLIPLGPGHLAIGKVYPSNIGAIWISGRVAL